jgi:hypothetical protein
MTLTNCISFGCLRARSSQERRRYSGHLLRYQVGFAGHAGEQSDRRGIVRRQQLRRLEWAQNKRPLGLAY